MARNDKLREEADRRRAVFFQSALATTEHFRPARMLDQIVGALDPDFTLLDRLAAEVKRNPFALLAAVGGLWLLTRQLKGNELLPNTKTRQGMRPLRLPRAYPKGDKNGYIDNAKQP